MSIPTSAGATSSYTFNPSAADVVLNAFAKIQIRRTELTTAHFADAAMESNFLAIDISNRNPNMWTRELVPLALTQGNATYTLPNRTIMVSVANIAITDGSGNVTEYVMNPVSGSDYATYPNKAYQDRPTSYFFSLLTIPTITFYPTPDADATYTANLWTFRQLQDVDLTNAASVDSPYRFLDAYATGLAARVAQIYRPEQVDKLEALFERRFQRAAATDQENVPISVVPVMAGYWR